MKKYFTSKTSNRLAEVGSGTCPSVSSQTQQHVDVKPLTTVGAPASRANSNLPFVRLLDQVKSPNQLRPLLTEAVRQALPTCKLATVHTAGELTSRNHEKLFQLIGECKERASPNGEPSCHQGLFKRTGGHYPVVTGWCDLTPGVDLVRPGEGQQGMAEIHSLVLVVDASDVADAELRSFFLLDTSGVKPTRLVIIAVTPNLNGHRISLLLTCLMKTLSRKDRKALEILKTQLPTRLARILAQPALSDSPYESHVTEHQEFASFLKKLCKCISEITEWEFCFILFKNGSREKLVCPATSEQAFERAKLFEISESAFKPLVHSDDVVEVNPKDHASLWSQLSESGINRLSGEVDHQADCSGDLKLQRLLCIPIDLSTELPGEPGCNCRGEENHLTLGESAVKALASRTSMQLANLVPNGLPLSSKAFVCLISFSKTKDSNEEVARHDSSARLKKNHEWIRSVTTSLLVQAIPWIGVLWSRNRDQHQHWFSEKWSRLISLSTERHFTYETFVDSLKDMISYQSCSIYVHDHSCDEWIVELLDYPIVEQTQVKKRYNETDLITERLSVSNQLSNQGSIHEVIAYLNNINSRQYLLELASSGQEMQVIVDLKKSTDITAEERSLLRHDPTGSYSVVVDQIHLRRKLKSLLHRNSITEELLRYHLQPPDEKVTQLCSCLSELDVRFCEEFKSFSFVPRLMEISDIAKSVYCMFSQLGLVQRWNIDARKLARFVLTVQQSYRNPSYHNWTHAFCVAHFTFLLAMNATDRLRNHLDDLELLTLFVGALCHDIDHRGYNNEHERSVETSFAILYGSHGSIMEHHHAEHTLRILGMEGCDILSELSSTEHHRAVQLVQEIILATDLENHLRVRPRLKAMASTGYNPDSREHRCQLISLLVTSSDLSDQCKPWTNTRVAASLIYNEFFAQGDEQKKRSGVTTCLPASMDREKAFIPDLQIHFLDAIVLPCFDMLSSLFPEFSVNSKSIEHNRRTWDHLLKLFSTDDDGFAYSTERLLSGEFDYLAETLADQ